jgi:hypothetical protein
MLVSSVVSARSLALAMVLALASHSTTKADTIYTYTGNNYTTIEDPTLPAGSYTTSMRLTGSFTLANSLPGGLTNETIKNGLTGIVLDYSFTDGRNTFTAANSGAGASFLVSTDATGAITDWTIQVNIGSVVPIGQQILFFQTNLNGDIAQIVQCTQQEGSSCITISADTGATQTAGTWHIASPSPVPLPAPLFLLAAALGCVGVVGWLRRGAPAVTASRA